MKRIAIIPARSGSKGIPNKNIRDLCGKPLIAYSIEAAIRSQLFDDIIVSTDTVQYADIAKKYGASVPFLRSQKNSQDNSSSWDMVEEVLFEYKKIGKQFDSFCLLQPTSPLRSEDDIIAAYNIFKSKSEFAVVSVCETEHSPLLSGRLPEDNQFIDFVNTKHLKRRQELDKYYRINGAIYIAYCNRFKFDKNLYQRGSYAYIMPQERSVDIDSEIDFELAKILLQKQPWYIYFFLKLNNH